MSSLKKLLDDFRQHPGISERKKGEAFEHLIRVWLTTDPLQSKIFSHVETYYDFAQSQGELKRDIGTDLVGHLRDGGYVAIQCKFYDENRVIQKKDIDSFLADSGRGTYKSRLIVETTSVPWSNNAKEMLRNSLIPVRRIGLQELESSQVDWSQFAGSGELEAKQPPKLRDYQEEALAQVEKKFTTSDRGKLIMACGTGKTLTSLRIAEKMAGPGSMVLYLVPSLSLMSQTVHAWCEDTLLELALFSVCSDARVGYKRKFSDDVAELEISDLAFPATTNSQDLAKAVARVPGSHMGVIFATYQSIEVLEQGQKEYGLPDFTLIIADEAHRTTGVTLSGDDESHFVKVHDNEFIRGHKRLYMTATQRIYKESAKQKAEQVDAVLASMDDEATYGETFYHMSFAKAVEQGYLCDYRVIVLCMDEEVVSAALQRIITSQGSSELILDDATKILGCWKALAKVGLELTTAETQFPMKRALAFCANIKKSKAIESGFSQVTSDKEYQEKLSCEVAHVDGSFDARSRTKLLNWLKDDTDDHVCRILTNARCLSEGVDIPALDSVLFLHPRKSQVDVVQAVGRVMRRSPGKKMGYVILPIGVPANIAPNKALEENKRYQVIWQVLNALRAHDERLNSTINQMELGQDRSDRIAIVSGGLAREKQGTTHVVEDFSLERQPSGSLEIGRGRDHSHKTHGDNEPSIESIIMAELSYGITAKIVEKCGTRDYWPIWAEDAAEIARVSRQRIADLVGEQGSQAAQIFASFLTELRDDLGPGITKGDALDLLAQHLMARPIFDSIFSESRFAKSNAISKAMDSIIDLIGRSGIAQETAKLDKFYQSVQRKADGVTDPKAKQKLLLKLYEDFFQTAFPKVAEQLGVVYTPVEIVDFMIHSVNDLLSSEFDTTLSSEGVHIIDPFVGTGTFLCRILESGLIRDQDLYRKYTEELHASEMTLLAYYIATVNIESSFDLARHQKNGDYVPYQKICLTDTFKEQDDQVAEYFVDNSNRIMDQKAMSATNNVQVIMGNPPYSGGQKSFNDHAANYSHAH
ncbi:MAG: DEAD/DEAH box helicase family protein, partial [Proteobacteria bacterium]|nr:DEAD/DEAH box helicase family protein [Pseudomonadota bacterium]